MSDLDLENYVEKGTNIFKIDGPIAGLTFLIINIFIAMVAFVGAFIAKALVFPLGMAAVILFAIFIFLPTMWASFVNFTKRLYDITGSIKSSVLITIGLYIVSLIFKPLSLISLIALVFIPGKLLK